MKKWILLFLALVLLISIASIGIGCKGKEAPKTAAEEEAKPAEVPKPAVEEEAKPAEAPAPPGLSFENPAEPIKQ
jgi:hypothetical protein